MTIEYKHNSLLFLLLLFNFHSLRLSAVGHGVSVAPKSQKQRPSYQQGKVRKERSSDEIGTFIVHLHPTYTHQQFEDHAHEMYRRKLFLYDQSRNTEHGNITRVDTLRDTNFERQLVIKQRFKRLLHAIVIHGFTRNELMSMREVRRVVRDSKKRILRTHIGERHTLESGFTPPTWGQDRIDQMTLPLNGRFEPEYDGRGTDIYVVDTGIDTNHIEFQNGPGFPNREVKNIWDAYAESEHEQTNPGG